MADQVFYTHHVGFKGSEALEEAYYNDVTHRLYIKFVNGNTAGYVNVPEEHFKALAAAQSAGSYYNAWIKYNFTGTHTDVVFVPVSTSQSVAGNAPLVKAVESPAKDSRNAKVPAFVVTVRVDGTLQFTVNDADAKAAIGQVEKILSNSGALDGSYTIEGVNKS